MRLCEVPEIINFKGTAIKRVPSFFICKDAAFGNSIAQKKAYFLARALKKFAFFSLP